MRHPFVLVLISVMLLLGGCLKEETISSPFADGFDRGEVGDSYLNTGAPYQIREGKLNVQGAFNHPLWLRKRLPRDAEIELDVTSKSAAGDIKVEAWGDGQSFAESKGAYLASSYVFIMGGWGNQISTLVRMDEHAPDRKQRTDQKVEVNRTYHWKIQRKGKQVQWFVDGKLFLSLEDPAPLEGDRHAYFGFNNWESDLYFDNLKIRPL